MEIKLLGKKTNDKRFVAYGSDDDWRCRCGKQADEGYYCEQKGFICKECQERDNMQRCLHDEFGEHQHLKILRIKDKDYFDSLNDVRFYDET